MKRVYRVLAAVAAGVLLLATPACGKDSPEPSDERLPNAGVIPAAVAATGPVFEDQLERYTINAPAAWQAELRGTPPQLYLINPDDRSVQIVGDFGAGVDLDAAKAKAAAGINRTGLSLSVVGEGRWWRRDGVEGWAVELEGTSSGQPIAGLWVWLIGAPGAVALVGAGPPSKKNAVRELVESVANSVMFRDVDDDPK